MTEPATPLMQQYHSIKARYPHALLLFRLGDFYELFYEDAMIASRELQITLTSRNREKGQPIPMCGVPYHAAEGYLARLIRAGYKIAICDQMEQPGPGKKLVRREVVRVITPGTATDLGVLDIRENNFLAAVAPHASCSPICLTFVDLSSGATASASIVSNSASLNPSGLASMIIRTLSRRRAPSSIICARPLLAASVPARPEKNRMRPVSKPSRISTASVTTNITIRSSSIPSRSAISNCSCLSFLKNQADPRASQL